MAVYIPLPGSKRALLPNSRPAGAVDPSEVASITVRVRSVGDPAALAKTAYDLANTPMAERQYLTHDELEKRHGAAQEDLDKIEHFAQEHNLMVVHRSAAQRSVVLKGTLGNLLGAFHADLQIYHHATGSYRGRKGEITLPQELSGIVTGIFGFDTRPKHRAPHRQKSAAFSGPGGTNGVAATDFATRYNFPANHNGTVLDGTGQTIAIIELGGGFRSSDLKVFFPRNQGGGAEGFGNLGRSCTERTDNREFRRWRSDARHRSRGRGCAKSKFRGVFRAKQR